MSRLWAVEVWVTGSAGASSGDHGINICEDYATVERLHHFHERRGD
jgi:hypothetical protein